MLLWFIQKEKQASLSGKRKLEQNMGIVSNHRRNENSVCLIRK